MSSPPHAAFAGAQAAPCPEFTPEEYRRFVDVTRQYEDERDAHTFLIRWDGDIRIEVRVTPSDRYGAQLQTVIDDLQELTPRIRFTIGAGDPIFFVH